MQRRSRSNGARRWGRGEAASWHDAYRLARAFAVKPVAPQSGAPPAGRWGLTARRGPSKGGHHAINAERCLASLTQLGRKFAGRATAIQVSAEARVPDLGDLSS